MKKTILTLLIYSFLGILGTNVFGQQFLWTTNKNNIFTNSEIKVIPKEDVINKLLEYYENYECYFDFTGFSKQGFLKKYINSIVGNDNKKIELLKNSIYKIKDLNITSIKGNLGNGSLIMILIVSKNNFDMIVFSNEPDKGFIITDDSEEGKNKFVKFYNSLIEN